MPPWRELGTFGSQDKCLNPKTNWDLYRRSSIGSTPAGTKLFKLVWKYFVSGVEMLHLWCGNGLFSFLSYNSVGTKSFQHRGKKNLTPETKNVHFGDIIFLHQFGKFSFSFLFYNRNEKCSQQNKKYRKYFNAEVEIFT